MPNHYSKEKVCSQELFEKHKIRPFIPLDADDTEKRIHNYLDEEDIFAIDIKEIFTEQTNGIYKSG